jgi:hypothetical protein
MIMGIIDRVKGLFAEPEEMPPVPLKDAKSGLEKVRAEKEAEAAEAASAKVSEVKHILRKLEETISAMEKRDIMKEGENKHLRKIVSTAQKNTAKQMRGLIVKLRPEMSGDADKISSYAAAGTEIITKEINAFRKNITYAGVIMKDEIKNIGILLQELMRLYSEISGIFSRSGIRNMDEIDRAMKGLDGLEGEVKEAEDGKEKAETEIGKLKAELREMEKLSGDMQKSPEYIKVEGIKRKIADIGRKRESVTAEYYSVISKADKAIRRFIKSVDAGVCFLGKDDKELLIAYTENPEEAAKKDPSAVRFRQLLAEIGKAIEEGRLKLKEKEKGKRLGAIKELVSYDCFTNLFWKLNGLEAEKNTLMR